MSDIILNNANRIGVVPGPILIGAEVEQNTRTGSTTQRNFKGSYEECQIFKQNELSLGASQVILKAVGDGDWTLTTYYPFDQFGFEPLAPSVHELETNVMMQNIYASPKLRRLFTDDQIAVIASVVRDYEGGKYPKEDGGDKNAEAEQDVLDQMDLNGGADVDDLAVDFFRNVAYRKNDTFIEYSSVYQRTLTAATPFQVRASLEGVGKIWTTGEVMNFERLDINGFFQLDADSQWLKSKPRVMSVAAQKTQVVYTYTECARASYFAYDPYGAARLLDQP